jgi:hypothetical protein
LTGMSRLFSFKPRRASLLAKEGVKNEKSSERSEVGFCVEASLFRDQRSLSRFQLIDSGEE